MKTLIQLRKAFDYSLQGVRNTFYDEIAFRIELAVAIILIPAALLLPVSLIVGILLILSALLVLIIELLNTVVEAAVNREFPQNNIPFCQSKGRRERSYFNGIHKSRSCMGYSLLRPNFQYFINLWK